MEKCHNSRTDPFAIEENGGINLYEFVNDNPVQTYDAFGLQSLLAIIECAEVPTFDFADCICQFAPDTDSCKNLMGGCLNAVGSKFMDVESLCQCLADSAESAGIIKSCDKQDFTKKCQASKKMKKLFSKPAKKPLSPISIPIPPPKK